MAQFGASRKGPKTGPALMRTQSAGPDRGAWSVGDACEAFYVEDGKYYKAEIVRVLGAGMYRINYTEYAFERDLKASEIRLPPGATPKPPAALTGGVSVQPRQTSAVPPRPSVQTTQSARVETRRPTNVSSQSVRVAPAPRVTPTVPTPAPKPTPTPAPATTSTPRPAPVAPTPRQPPKLAELPPSGISATALFEFRAAKPTEIDLNVGDLITNIQQTGQWWTGTANGRTGKFPYNYVEVHPAGGGGGGGGGGHAAPPPRTVAATTTYNTTPTTTPTPTTTTAAPNKSIPVPPRPSLRKADPVSQSAPSFTPVPPRPAFSGSASMIVKPVSSTPPPPPTSPRPPPPSTVREAPPQPSPRTAPPPPKSKPPPPVTTPTTPTPPVSRPPPPAATKPPVPTPPVSTPRPPPPTTHTTTPTHNTVDPLSKPPTPSPVSVPPRPAVGSVAAGNGGGDDGWGGSRSKRMSTKKLPPAPTPKAGGGIPPPPPPGGGIPPPPPPVLMNGHTTPTTTPTTHTTPAPAVVKRAAPAAPAASSGFKAKESVSAQWREDGQWYAAVIDRVFDEGGVTYYDITFTEYGNSETYYTKEELKKLPGAAKQQESNEPPPPPGSFAAALAAKANKLNQTGLISESSDTVEVAVSKKSGNIASSLEQTKVTKRALNMSVYMPQDKLQGVDEAEWEDDDDDACFDF